MEIVEMHRLREEIDRIDRTVLDLLNQRATLAVKIGRSKQGNGLPAWDPAREMAILESLDKQNHGPLPHASLKHIFGEIFSACRGLQDSIRVAYLGPEATFTHMATIEYFGRSCTYSPQGSIIDVFHEVERGNVQYGVVPVENSTEGAVNITLDRLIRSELKICGEITMRISHVLMSREDELRTIERVFSHPQALSQCREWLLRNLPNRELIETSSTAAAALMAKEQVGGAAVGSELTARQQGLRLLARDIQDHSLNFTRFIVLGKEICQKTARDKTSILFIAQHRPGSLHKALGPFAEQGINLTRIESRPTKERPWEYVFFVDLEGHIGDQEVKRALENVEDRVEYLKVLGSYPRRDIGPDLVKEGGKDSAHRLNEGVSDI